MVAKLQQVSCHGRDLWLQPALIITLWSINRVKLTSVELLLYVAADSLCRCSGRCVRMNKQTFSTSSFSFIHFMNVLRGGNQAMNDYSRCVDLVIQRFSAICSPRKEGQRFALSKGPRAGPTGFLTTHPRQLRGF